MWLTVDAAPDELTATSFTFVVPGDQLWTVRSVVATVQTGAGGAPDRGYLLIVTDGTNTVAQVGNTDGPTDPGGGTLTWANAPSGTNAIDNTFASLAPLPNLKLKPGYTITGEIVNAVAGDQFISANVWYDFQYTTQR